MKKFYSLLLVVICIGVRIHAQTPPPCNIIVDFIADTSLHSSTVNFTNLTTSFDATDSVIWSFGDGYISSDVNTSHTYINGGIYTVCLRIVKNNASPVCANEYCREVYVPIACGSTPDFNFTRSQDSFVNSFIFYGITPYTAYDSYTWDFGDGSVPVVTVPYNPVMHQFPSTGSYTVCLTRKRTVPGTTTVLCEMQVCKPFVYNTATCNTTANFSYNTNPLNTQQFQFTNLTTPFAATDSVYWLFGDGYSSQEINPVHTYNDGGVYNVCLRAATFDAANAGVACYADLCQQVTVPYTCNIVPAFYWAADSFQTANSFDFFNTTRPYNFNDSAFWDFGDGTPLLYSNSVVRHVFANTGTYNVCLIIKKMIPGTNTVVCQQQVCNTLIVGDPPSCNIQAAFTNQPYLAGNADLQQYFIAEESAGATYSWDFGDGNTGAGLYAMHQYAQQGNYNVCLTASVGSNCNSSICRLVNVLPSLCDTNTVSFTYNRDYYLPNKLYFFEETFSPARYQVWNVEKISSVPDTNYTFYQYTHSYVFSDTGRYKVCLTANFQNGCTKTFCDTVQINSITTPSTCYLQAFPNPVSNTVNINVELEQAGAVTSTVFTFQGMAVNQVAQQGAAGNNVISINVASLPAGFYSLQVNYGNKVCYSRFQKI